MIERDIVNYLLSIADINTAVKGNIFYRRAKTKAVMPWIVVTNNGGNRYPMTQGFSPTSPGKTKPKDTLSIYVESMEQFKGRDIANRVEQALDRYRGDMGDTKDAYITTGTIRDLDGWQGSFRFLITVYAEYVIPTNVPG